MIGRHLPLLALFAMAVSLAGGPRAAGSALRPTLVQTPIPEGAGARAAALARVVKGIVSYTRWPAAPRIVRICIVGRAQYDQPLIEGMSQAPGPAVEIDHLAIDHPQLPDACNALYVGEVTDQERQELFARIAGHSILTIIESDPTCRGGGMFCLRIDEQQIGFEMNIDAVARSGTRVHPKVLLLARPQGPQS